MWPANVTVLTKRRDRRKEPGIASDAIELVSHKTLDEGESLQPDGTRDCLSQAPFVSVDRDFFRVMPPVETGPHKAWQHLPEVSDKPIFLLCGCNPVLVYYQEWLGPQNNPVISVN